MSRYRRKWKSNFPKPPWAVDQLLRETGLVEDLCKHGIGHPNLQWLQGKAEHWGIHGCDGCCYER